MIVCHSSCWGIVDGTVEFCGGIHEAQPYRLTVRRPLWLPVSFKEGYRAVGGSSDYVASSVGVCLPAQYWVGSTTELVSHLGDECGASCLFDELDLVSSFEALEY